MGLYATSFLVSTILSNLTNGLLESISTAKMVFGKVTARFSTANLEPRKLDTYFGFFQKAGREGIGHALVEAAKDFGIVVSTRFANHPLVQEPLVKCKKGF
jgi:hypothetical protein